MALLGEHPYRNVIVFMIGTVVSALGAVMSTKSILGVSPSSSIPYVISEIGLFGLSYGTWTFIVQIVFFLLGILVMGRRNYKLIFLLTVPTLVLYSLVSDLLVGPLEPLLHPDSYLGEWVLIIVATFVHAFGIALQLASNLSMTPIDMFANFFACRKNREYGAVKVVIDVILVVIAAVLSLLAFRKLVGVREGTLFAAIAVGLIVRYVSKLFIAKGFYDWVGHLTIEFKSKDCGCGKTND